MSSARPIKALMPMVKVFTTKDLKDSLTDAGFEIDYQWQAGKINLNVATNFGGTGA